MSIKPLGKLLRQTAFRLLPFVGIDVVTFALRLSVAGFLHRFVHMPKPLALGVSLALAFFCGFWLERKALFRNSTFCQKKGGVLYAAVALGSILLVFGITLALMYCAFFNTHYLLATSLASVATFVLTFPFRGLPHGYGLCARLQA